MKINNYQVLKLLGKGGEGEVYHVKDTLGSEYALKLYKESRKFAELEREMNIIQSIDHQSIIPLRFSDYTEAGELIMVYPYYSAGSLEHTIETGSLKLNEQITIANQMISAVDYLHKKEIMHRDIKPENIFLEKKTTGLEAILGDMGLAKRLSDSSFSRSLVGGLGTYKYFSPEYMAGDRANHIFSDDIYALGVTLYRLFTSKFPYGETIEELAKSYGNSLTQIVPIRKYNAQIPKKLEYICMKSIILDTSKRYNKMDQLMVDLKKSDQEIEKGFQELFLKEQVNESVVRKKSRDLGQTKTRRRNTRTGRVNRRYMERHQKKEGIDKKFLYGVGVGLLVATLGVGSLFLGSNPRKNNNEVVVAKKNIKNEYSTEESKSKTEIIVNENKQVTEFVNNGEKEELKNRSSNEETSRATNVEIVSSYNTSILEDYNKFVAFVDKFIVQKNNTSDLEAIVNILGAYEEKLIDESNYREFLKYKGKKIYDALLGSPDKFSGKLYFSLPHHGWFPIPYEINLYRLEKNYHRLNNKELERAFEVFLKPTPNSRILEYYAKEAGEENNPFLLEMINDMSMSSVEQELKDLNYIRLFGKSSSAYKFQKTVGDRGFQFGELLKSLNMIYYDKEEYIQLPLIGHLYVHKKILPIFEKEVNKLKQLMSSRDIEKLESSISDIQKGSLDDEQGTYQTLFKKYPLLEEYYYLKYYNVRIDKWIEYEISKVVDRYKKITDKYGITPRLERKILNAEIKQLLTSGGEQNDIHKLFTKSTRFYERAPYDSEMLVYMLQTFSAVDEKKMNQKSAIKQFLNSIDRHFESYTQESQELILPFLLMFRQIHGSNFQKVFEHYSRFDKYKSQMLHMLLKESEGNHRYRLVKEHEDDIELLGKNLEEYRNKLFYDRTKNMIDAKYVTLVGEMAQLKNNYTVMYEKEKMEKFYEGLIKLNMPYNYEVYLSYIESLYDNNKYEEVIGKLEKNKFLFYYPMSKNVEDSYERMISLKLLNIYFKSKKNIKNNLEEKYELFTRDPAEKGVFVNKIYGNEFPDHIGYLSLLAESYNYCFDTYKNDKNMETYLVKRAVKAMDSLSKAIENIGKKNRVMREFQNKYTKFIDDNL